MERPQLPFLCQGAKRVGLVRPLLGAAGLDCPATRQLAHRLLLRSGPSILATTGDGGRGGEGGMISPTLQDYPTRVTYYQKEMEETDNRHEARIGNSVQTLQAIVRQPKGSREAPWATGSTFECIPSSPQGEPRPTLLHKHAAGRAASATPPQPPHADMGWPDKAAGLTCIRDLTTSNGLLQTVVTAPTTAPQATECQRFFSPSELSFLSWLMEAS